MEIVSIVEPNRHELYRASINSPEELAFAATFTHQLEARELEDEVKDESLLALQESYRRINQEKEAST
jgi:RNA polymerase II elongation factor ELL